MYLPAGEAAPLVGPEYDPAGEAALTVPLRTLGPNGDITQVLLADADEALEGMDYEELKAGLLPTSEHSCEEYLAGRLAARALARHIPGGRMIYEV
jgi:hypothetical protein